MVVVHAVSLVLATVLGAMGMAVGGKEAFSIYALPQVIWLVVDYFAHRGRNKRDTNANSLSSDARADNKKLAQARISKGSDAGADSENPGQAKAWKWPITTKEEAIHASRNGAYAAFVSGVLTLAFFFYALAMNTADGIFGLYNDPTVLIDIAVILACGFGMLRNSRAAAVTIFIWFIIGKVVIAMETGQIPGAALSLVFVFFFGRAIQGSFTYHKIEKAENPDYRPAPRWMYWFGIPSGLLLFLAVIFGLTTQTALLPSTKVLSGDELPRGEYVQLLAAGIILADENLEYFYSESFASVLEAGNILTDRRVIGYWTDENGERIVYDIPIAYIVSVELVELGNFFNDSIYQVNSYDPEVWLQIVLSREGDGDIEFVEALRAKIVQ